MTIEAEIITPNLRGVCVTDANRIHMLFRPAVTRKQPGGLGPLAEPRVSREKLDEQMENLSA